jgi:preprotein translocase subunit SecD
MSELLDDWRVRIWIAAVILFGIIPLFVLPMFMPARELQFGMDFEGGTLIQLKLERTLDSQSMASTTLVLQERLNRYGLKDISVKPYGDEYIIVSVSSTDPENVESLKNVLSQEGKFEAIIDGTIVLYPDDLVEVITDPKRGYFYSPANQQWQVPFTLSKDGSERFARVAEGKCVVKDGVQDCGEIYIFIDRPENATILVPNSVYNQSLGVPRSPESPPQFDIPFDEFQQNTLVKILPVDDVTQETLSELKGSRTVLVHPELPNQELLENKSFQVKVVQEIEGENWFKTAVSLESILSLSPGVTTGDPIRNAVIQGYSEDWESANREMTEMVVLLKSGRLPVGVEIAGTNTVSATLGESFLQDLMLLGVIAWVLVGTLVLIRYRDFKMTALVMVANLSEVLIILGIAALIAWEMDIASVAGIIAVVGTGVDQFIIMNDELELGRSTDETILDKIKRAFRIIMGSAATVTVAMLPLLTLGMGLLKGFAITTLIGLFAGVVIVRPGFARIIEKWF